MKMSPSFVPFQLRTAIGTLAVAAEQTIKIHISHRRRHARPEYIFLVLNWSKMQSHKSTTIKQITNCRPIFTKHMTMWSGCTETESASAPFRF